MLSWTRKTNFQATPVELVISFFNFFNILKTFKHIKTKLANNWQLLLYLSDKLIKRMSHELSSWENATSPRGCTYMAKLSP